MGSLAAGTGVVSANNGIVLGKQGSTPAVLTIGGDGTNTTYAASINDSNPSGGNSATNVSSSGGSLVKIGGGTQTFSGSNTFSGATKILGGTLSVTTLGNGAISTTGTTTGVTTTATTATGTSGTNTLTVASNSGLEVGQSVSGTGVGGGVTVTNVNGTTVTLSGTCRPPQAGATPSAATAFLWEVLRD